MVIFEFKRPGDTAHQKKKSDFRWEFSELVEDYFDQFLYGQEKDKKNYRENIVKITTDTPNFGYIIMDEPDNLIDFNKHKGWRRTPFGSYYKINGDLNLHIEAITFQNLLVNVKKDTIFSLITYLFSNSKYNMRNLFLLYLIVNQ